MAKKTVKKEVESLVSRTTRQDCDKLGENTTSIIFWIGLIVTIGIELVFALWLFPIIDVHNPMYVGNLIIDLIVLLIGSVLLLLSKYFGDMRKKECENKK